MFRKYIRWQPKRKELFTENMRNGHFAEVSVRSQINVRIYGIVKWRQELNVRNIAVNGGQQGIANGSETSALKK